MPVPVRATVKPVSNYFEIWDLFVSTPTEQNLTLLYLYHPESGQARQKGWGPF
jgi:hypothetical protein